MDRIYLHPCCQNGKLCVTGRKRQERLKQEELPRRRIRVHGDPGCRFDCEHLYCKRAFTQNRDRNKHQREDVHICIQKGLQCKLCKNPALTSLSELPYFDDSEEEKNVTSSFEYLPPSDNSHSVPLEEEEEEEEQLEEEKEGDIKVKEKMNLSNILI